MDGVGAVEGERVNDKERLDWLEQQQGMGLVSSDTGFWAVSTGGFQNLPEADKAAEPFDFTGWFDVERDTWCSTIREAIDLAMKLQP